MVRKLFHCLPCILVKLPYSCFFLAPFMANRFDFLQLFLLVPSIVDVLEFTTFVSMVIFRPGCLVSSIRMLSQRRSIWTLTGKSTHLLFTMVVHLVRRRKMRSPVAVMKVSWRRSVNRSAQRQLLVLSRHHLLWCRVLLVLLLLSAVVFTMNLVLVLVLMNIMLLLIVSPILAPANSIFVLRRILQDCSCWAIRTLLALQVTHKDCK